MSDESIHRMPMIGRQDVLETITQAIQGQGPSILLLEGIAGIGKTVLLNAAGRIAQEQGDLCPPVIDFYDTAMHSHQALEATIAHYLDPDEQKFEEYWRQRKRDPQAELWKPFQEGYQAALGNKRAVLRFDTVERLEYERDSQEVWDDCEIEDQEAPSWEWLLKRIGRLPNTTILIAARPTLTGLLRQRLREEHGDSILVLKITSFTQTETEEYFRATEFGRQVTDESPEMMAKVHLLTDGRPILIALAIDWLKLGMWDELFYPVAVADLRAWKAEAQTEEEAGQRGEAWQRWRDTEQQLEAALVEQIRRLASPLDVAVRYVALCRKGCNAAILSRLMEIDQEQADSLVGELLTLSFVKPPRSGSHSFFFLHDEMYDLVEKYVWLVDWPDYGRQAELDEVIIKWYDELIKGLEEKIKRSRDYQERVALHRQQMLLMAERLYYQFDADPREGYRIYSRLDEEAIASRELEWDHLLRNEGLWFTQNRGWRLVEKGPTIEQDGKIIRNPTIDYDCRRRWIWRYIAQNKLQKAIRVAERLLDKPKDELEPELWRPGVQVALAAALAYQGGEYAETALARFREGIKLLDSVPEEHREDWLHPYLLGTAYLHQGLALRNRLLLDEVARSYRRAIAHFRGIRHRPRIAEAWNNLAYIYARQGKLEQARNICRQALYMRQGLADKYGEALSQNTLGIIHERRNRPLTAIEYSTVALKLFQEVGSRRGIILANINLGRSYRRKARSPDWGQKKEDFDAGEQCLNDAIDLQRTMGADAEIFYKIEALNERGCLHRDRLATLHEKDTLTDDRAVELLDLGETDLLAAISLASTEDGDTVPLRSLVQYVDSAEDLARVYYWRGKLELDVGEYGQRLEIGEPSEVERRLLQLIVDVTQKDDWTGREEIDLLLGKMHFQYARLERELGFLGTAAEHYARAAAYLTRYSLDAPELQKTVTDVCDWLAEVPTDKVQEIVNTLALTLHAQGIRSILLRDSVEACVYTMHGAHWPLMPDEEMLYG